MVFGATTQQFLWVTHLLWDVLKDSFMGDIFCDNQSAVQVATDDYSNKGTQDPLIEIKTL